MINEKLTAAKNSIAAKAAYAATAAWLVGNNLMITAYADGDDALGAALKSSLTEISNRAISALAAIMGIAALISGAWSVFQMAEGSKSNQPEQQDRGQKGLTAAIGMAVAAAVLLGIKATIASLITTAMG